MPGKMQSAKTVSLFKNDKVRQTAYFCSWIEVVWSSQPLSQPCIDLFKKYAKCFLIYPH